MKDFFKSELSKQIWEKKYRNGDESFNEWLDRVSGHNKKIRKLIEEKKFIFGGRTLANRGLTGSLSNCYTSGCVGDSLDEIMDIAKNIALTFKAQGGQGVSLSLIRPKGSIINGRFKSDGIVPFMEIFDTVAANISQGGARRGALLMSLDITHQEAETFMSIKTDLNKINNANLSLEITDDFMYYIDEYYTKGLTKTMTIQQTYAADTEVIEYTITPINLFKILCKHAWECAEPGVLFMDTINKYNLNEFDPNYTIECSNPCGEQPLIKNGACNLSAINLARYVLNPFSDRVKFDYNSLQEDLYYIYEAMNDILDEGMDKHALPEQREVAKKWRNIGIGITGLAELFIMFKTPYGSARSIRLTNDIMKFLFTECFKLNQYFGKKDGNFPAFNVSNYYGSTEIVRNALGYEKTERSIENLRNCSMLTVAPTGSISNLIGASSMGIEPLFALQYQRRTVSLDGKESVYTVYPEVVELYLKMHPEDTIDSLPYYFVTAADISWKTRIDVQAVAQQYVDSAISSTVNIPQETTVEEVEQLYLYAWKKGLKGVTIYREGSRDPILFTEPKPQEETTEEVTPPINHAEKRPRVLKAKLTVNKAKGLSYAVIVGFLHDRPYEIFAFEMPKDSQIKPCDGEIIKIKKGQYSFKCEYFTIDNLQLATDKLEERALTILCSMMLRHNIGIQYIIKTAKKVNPVVSSFSSVVCRVLGSYMKDSVVSNQVCPECGAPLVMEGGCEHCSSCTYSKCNLLIKTKRV